MTKNKLKVLTRAEILKDMYDSALTTLTEMEIKEKYLLSLTMSEPNEKAFFEEKQKNDRALPRQKKLTEIILDEIKEEVKKYEQKD